ncbi:MAG: RNA methyltransferase [Lachnospiraceae bacterium]|nr:RNA methyltransferase [Lachnospiraceae bacterium]
MITAINNSRVKKVVQLNQKAKARKEENVFVVEGCKMFLEAPAERIRDIFVTESFYYKNEACRSKLENCKYEFVSEEILAKMSDTKTPQGILCVVVQHTFDMQAILEKPDPLFVILEDLQDPGNLGTIIRTGEGAGIDGVFMSRNTVDIYNPKTIRATMGSIYRVPFWYVEDMKSLFQQLHTHGIKTYAAHLKGERYYDQNAFQQGTAFVIGNEGNGLQKETADMASAYIKIPMEGQVESLNAAIATSLLMYEARRQRAQII